MNIQTEDLEGDALLSAVSHRGSLRDAELSIRTVGPAETQEIALCRENRISQLVASAGMVPA